MTPDRYDTSRLIEDQYEPGSNGTVLRNKKGITDSVEMGEAETNALWRAQRKLIGEVTNDQPFTVEDICMMHRLWLKSIYPWAGQFRGVNISKGGFDFAQARFIPALMDEFERKQLREYTPCCLGGRDEAAHALAEVHVELMLIHPFREGNGRLGRLLATLMALQAGLPVLDFSLLDGDRREEYFAAVQAGLDRNYLPMKRLFAEIIERSLPAS
ncbi:Fic/DOC family protein [Geobacter anodireducens]|uniref:Fic/DOC family protein n=1 Tax=Geobacter anodireducens TaxID=1340425 RepID=UPI0008338EA3|nr:Fic family protein [Geobacter anodireducens]